MSKVMTAVIASVFFAIILNPYNSSANSVTDKDAKAKGQRKGGTKGGEVRRVEKSDPKASGASVNTPNTNGGTTINNNTDTRDKETRLADSLREQIKECKDDACKAPLQEKLDRLEARIISGTDPVKECKDRTKELSDSYDKLMTTCREVAVAGALDTCLKYIEGCKDNEEETAKAIPNPADGNLYFPGKLACDLVQKCPARVAFAMKNWDKASGEYKEKLIKSQNDKLDAESAEKQLQTQMLAETEAINNQIRKISDDEQAILSSLPEQNANLDMNMRNQINLLRDSIGKAQDELNKAETDQRIAIVEFQNAIGSIDAGCKSSARNKFDTAVAAAGNNVGGLGSLVGNPSHGRRTLARVEDYECSQPSVVAAKAAAQRTLDARLSSNQIQSKRYQEIIANQQKSFQDIFRQFSQQQQAAAKRNQNLLREKSTEKTSLMQKLARITQELQHKGDIAMQKRLNAEQRTRELEIGAALREENRSCTAEFNPGNGEKASPQASVGLLGNFSNTAGAYCAAVTSCDPNPVSLTPISVEGLKGQVADKDYDFGSLFTDYRECVEQNRKLRNAKMNPTKADKDQ
ncbi:MAG: hypothetical protein A4S09_05615 [Proteobacteria bacterium SG_bin7]|nr:MAG: hypothetical protein A4S09_05615 [Proteobacteria bacterium SG_bin7]